MYVCLCRAVTEAAVRELGRCGVTEPDDLIEVLQLDEPSCCGFCKRNVLSLAELAQEAAAEAGVATQVTAERMLVGMTKVTA